MNARLNVLQGFRTSNLVSAQSAKGESVLKLDRDRDGRVDRHDPVLVLRDSVEAAWRPVKDADELKGFLEATPGRERGERLGLWRDARRWVIFSPDGDIQKREVFAIGGPPKDPSAWTLRGGTPRPRHAEDMWNQEKFHHLEEQLHEEYRVPECTAYFYVKTDPAQVNVGTVDGQPTFNESLVVSRTHMEQVTCFGRDGNNYVPLGFKDVDYRGVLD